MSSPVDPFAAAAARAVADALGLPPGDFEVTQPPRPELGDYAVGCFPAARALKQAPPAVAARAAAAFEPDGLLVEATAAGPFVNFRADRAAMFRHLFRGALAGRDATGLVPQEVGAGKTVCVDFSSPNI